MNEPNIQEEPACHVVFGVLRVRLQGDEGEEAGETKGGEKQEAQTVKADAPTEVGV